MSTLTTRQKAIPAWDIPAQQMLDAATRRGSHLVADSGESVVVGIIRYAENQNPDKNEAQRYGEAEVRAYLTTRWGWQFACHLRSGQMSARLLISGIPGRPTFSEESA